jgi:hypothetical protein
LRTSCSKFSSVTGTADDMMPNPCLRALTEFYDSGIRGV